MSTRFILENGFMIHSDEVEGGALILAPLLMKPSIFVRADTRLEGFLVNNADPSSA